MDFLVFTLPHELNPVAQGKPALIYALLFKAASRTLLEFGRNPRWLGAELVITMVLHTWGQNTASLRGQPSLGRVAEIDLPPLLAGQMACCQRQGKLRRRSGGHEVANPFALPSLWIGLRPSALAPSTGME